MSRTVATHAGILSALLLAAACVAGAQVDAIRIVSISPDRVLQRGLPVTLTVAVDAELRSDTAGVVRIGFNDAAPDQFRMTESRTVHSGRQRLVFNVRTVPVDWQGEGQFTMLVNIGPPTESRTWKATAVVRRADFGRS